MELKKLFYMMKLWAYQFKIHNFPKKLESLEVENPSNEMMDRDMNILLSYNNHPAYNSFFYPNARMAPSYKEG